MRGSANKNNLMTNSAHTSVAKRRVTDYLGERKSSTIGNSYSKRTQVAITSPPPIEQASHLEET